MASLVADYGTSSGEESDSCEETQSGPRLSGEQPKKQEVNFFSAAADSDSEDENGEEQQTTTTSVEKSRSNKLPNPLALPEKLPTPLLTPSAASGLETSVFSSSYHKAEAAKNYVLEQHVKMTSAEIQAKTKDGKRICWNFRKGKCRFGQKCKYSHGVDIPGVVAEEVASEYPVEPNIHQVFNQTGPGCKGNPGQSITDPDDDSYMAEAKRKKRVGMASALIPPKKAMHALHQQREHERPWTVQK